MRHFLVRDCSRDTKATPDSSFVIFQGSNRSDDRAFVPTWYLFEESPGSGGQAAR
jgi:hypothetical protein